MDLTEKTIEKNYIYNGRIINLRNDKIMLPNGKVAYREVVEHNGGVCIAALTEKNEILLVRQYRYPYAEALIEIPAGKLERGEDTFDCARRELKEETGATAESISFLGKMYPSPGYTAEVIYIYKAKGLTFGSQHLDEDEFLNVLKVPLTEAAEMIKKGEIVDAKTTIAVLKLMNETEA